nr:ketopantoate reductase family protein [Chloroflexota bacterium]
MRVLVFGAGAIGSLLGHRLASAGHEVILVGRPSYVHAVQEHGLILERAKAPGSHAVYPSTVANISDIPVSQRHWDMILLTVKAYDTREAALTLAPYASNDIPLLIVQNGVGGEELAQRVWKQAAIISGVLTLSVSVLAPGRIRLETTRGGLNLAPTRGDMDVDRWARLFSTAGLKTATYHDYRAMKWSKLLLNIQANAIPAILDMTPAAVFAHAALFAIERSAFLEALAVMQAMRLSVVSFPGYPVPLLVWAMQAMPASLLRPLLMRLVATGRGDKRPSLYMDLASGRQRSEVLYLNGAVAAHAERLGLDVPVNRTLCDVLTGIVTGRIPWDDFRGQPQRLVAKIQHTSPYSFAP